MKYLFGFEDGCIATLENIPISSNALIFRLFFVRAFSVCCGELQNNSSYIFPISSLSLSTEICAEHHIQLKYIFHIY